MTSPAPAPQGSTARTILLGLGLTLLAAGLLVGFVPLKHAGTSCGTAWVKSDAAYVADLARTLGGAPADGLTGLSPIEDACDSKKTPLRIASGVLLVLGVGVVITRASVRA